MKKFIAYTILILLGLLIFGPRPNFEQVTQSMAAIEGLSIANAEQYLKTKEANVQNLRPDNEAQIIWANGSAVQTEYCVVYLHGFSASHGEGEPVHKNFAQRYGCNLLLSRLDGHGIADEESFKDSTPKKLVESAKEAIQIGKLLGTKIILMSCSTGSTLAVYLAAGNPDIDALILYSPNLDLYDSNSHLVMYPWGQKIAEQFVFKGKYRGFDAPKAAQQYWTNRYRIEGVQTIRGLINQTMTDEVFAQINQPVFLGYYYENEEKYDKIVSIDRMKAFYELIQTPENQKRMMAFKEPGQHILTSKYWHSNFGKVEEETYNFAEEVLALKAQNTMNLVE